MLGRTLVRAHAEGNFQAPSMTHPFTSLTEPSKNPSKKRLLHDPLGVRPTCCCFGPSLVASLLSQATCRNSGVVFTGGSSRKGVRVPSGVPGKGVWVRVQAGGGEWVFLWKTRGRGRGWGGQGVEWGQTIRTHLSKLPFSKLPLVVSLKDRFL